jgi:hypothetical protein
VGPVAVNLSPDQSGIRFDDAIYSSSLRRLLVPGAATGKLFLIEPITLAVTAISGFAAPPPSPDGWTPASPRGGITSVAEAQGMLYASNRTDSQMYIVDPWLRRIISTVPLGGNPDYIRYVASTDELWVTEPDGPEGIEVFGLRHHRILPRRLASIPIEGGPERLYINAERKLAYTSHSDPSSQGAPRESLVLDVRKRSVVGQWASGCATAKGVLGDDENGLAVFGCGGGGVTVVDIASGKIVSQLSTASNVDSFGFSPRLRHLYLPGPRLTIVGLSRQGSLTKLGEVVTPGNPTKHAIADDRGHAFVLLPDTGQVLRVTDTYPATR